MSTIVNEMERHISWADKLFDIIRFEEKEVGFISKITDKNITEWKEWARRHEFIYDKKRPVCCIEDVTRFHGGV